MNGTSGGGNGMPERAQSMYKGSTGRAGHRSRSHADAHADSAEPSQPIPKHALIPTSAPVIIDTQPALVQLLNTLRAAGTFAYDSEFIGELTYVPKLCLVQVCWKDGVGLIDPLADGVDLTDFWKLLCDKSVAKIVHAGEQDVEPTARLLGTACGNVFDTQIAAGLAGMPYPVSLSKLVGEITGAKLGKSFTVSHWDQRPLSPMQLRYAADDVRYLLAVHDYLIKLLEPLGHVDWAMQESDAMCQTSEFGFDPDSAYLRVRGATSLQPKALTILRELTIWRDGCARRHDVPARSFLKDEILVDMSRQPIKSVDKLARVKGLPRPVESQYGQEIVDVTARGMSAPLVHLPRWSDYEPPPTARFRADGLWAAAQALAIGQRIDPNLITSRQEIGELHRRLEAKEDTSSMRVMKHWRKDALGQPLSDLFHGKRTMHAAWVDAGLKLS